MLKYTLIRPLGEGGMGHVFFGVAHGAEGFQRPVAIKRIRDDLCTPEFERMFEREAKIASLLIHPNIVQTLDFDRDEEGRPFLVMEFVYGKTLVEFSADMTLSVEVALAIFTQLLEALIVAHRCHTRNGVQCIIHRDISPQNILLTPHGVVKLADFGLARALDVTRLTRPHTIQGKAQYMSPEQARGEELDPRTDLFSAGLVLWEMLTGEPLFANDRETDPLKALQHVLEDPIEPPSSRNPEIADEIDHYCLRLLARARDQRIDSALEALESLHHLGAKPDRLELMELLRTHLPEPGTHAFGEPSKIRPLESFMMSPSKLLAKANAHMVAEMKDEAQALLPTDVRPVRTENILDVMIESSATAHTQPNTQPILTTQRPEPKNHEARRARGRLGQLPVPVLLLLLVAIGLASAALFATLAKVTFQPRPRAIAPVVTAAAVSNVVPRTATSTATSVSEPRLEPTGNREERVEKKRTALRTTEKRSALDVSIEVEILLARAISKSDLETIVATRGKDLRRCFSRHVHRPRTLKAWFISTSGFMDLNVAPLDASDKAARRFETCVRDLNLPIPPYPGRSFDILALVFESKRRIL